MKGSNVKRKSESDDSPRKKAKTNDQKKSFLDKGGVEEIIRDMLRKENTREVPSSQFMSSQQLHPQPGVWPQVSQSHYGVPSQVQPHWVSQPVMMGQPTLQFGNMLPPGQMSAANQAQAGIQRNFSQQN